MPEPEWLEVGDKAGLRFNSKMGENEGRGDAGGLSRRLVDDNHPVFTILSFPLLYFTAYILALLRSARTSQVAGCVAPSIQR